MVAPHLADPHSALTYPVDSRAAATLRIADYDIALVADSGHTQTLGRMSTTPTEELAAELDGATSWLNLTADEVLIAALGRTIARTIGDGMAAVDVSGERQWLLQPVLLSCATGQQASATELLGMVHRGLAVAPEHPVGVACEIFFNNVGTVSEVPMHETPRGLGYALELRVYRMDGMVHLDWWYDTGRFDAYTIEEMAEQFPLALFEMTSDAGAPF
ncbi:hypothetical protein [Mycobacterium sp. URHB0021]|jgi:hypothetical protein